MFDNLIYKTDIIYEQYNGVNSANIASYLTPVTIKGLLKSGSFTVTTSSDGDTQTCSYRYRTKEKIVKNSKLNGRTVIDCVPVDSFMSDAGYLSYVK